VASYVPYFVKMDDRVEIPMKILEEQLLLPCGVTCSTPGEYKYNLQWDYPNIWAPLQYIAYMSCVNYGYLELAKKIAQTYTTHLETNFAKTGNLWEKYNGYTGDVVNAEYHSPVMLGWTAGVYLALKSTL
jgi:alpha,alpha-trehalase